MKFVCTCTYRPTLNDMSYKIKYTSKINIESECMIIAYKKIYA